MASNTKLVDGAETVMFTSRSKATTITLKAEPGKSVVLDGTSGGGGGEDLISSLIRLQLNWVSMKRAHQLLR